MTHHLTFKMMLAERLSLSVVFSAVLLTDFSPCLGEFRQLIYLMHNSVTGKVGKHNHWEEVSAAAASVLVIPGDKLP